MELSYNGSTNLAETLFAIKRIKAFCNLIYPKNGMTCLDWIFIKLCYEVCHSENKSNTNRLLLILRK